MRFLKIDHCDSSSRLSPIWHIHIWTLHLLSRPNLRPETYYCQFRGTCWCYWPLELLRLMYTRLMYTNSLVNVDFFNMNFTNTSLVEQAKLAPWDLLLPISRDLLMLLTTWIISQFSTVYIVCIWIIKNTLRFMVQFLSNPKSPSNSGEKNE